MSVGLLTQRQGQLGVNFVEQIILKEWNCRWQPIDAVNDDGVDGLIFIERGGIPTGQVIHVQVKCQVGTLRTDGFYELKLARKKLKSNAARWRKIVGAAILIRVDPDKFEAQWTDLKDGVSVRRTQILVPAANKFDAKAKRSIADLCGTLHVDLLFPQIKTAPSDFDYLSSGLNVGSCARREYAKLNDAGLRFSDSDAEIRFTREGWRHMNRVGRRKLAKFQSWCLIGALHRILPQLREEWLEFVRPERPGLPELVAATATVLFPHRQSGIVRVVFRKRTDKAGAANYSLHTLYEPRRRKNLIGNA